MAYDFQIDRHSELIEPAIRCQRPANATKRNLHKLQALVLMALTPLHFFRILARSFWS